MNKRSVAVKQAEIEVHLGWVEASEEEEERGVLKLRST